MSTPNDHHHTCLRFWGSDEPPCSCPPNTAARVNDMLTALSEAVTHAQDQMPDSAYTQGMEDAERLVWEALGAI